jgi:beta-N-acetylhexosaminidase
MFGMSPSQIGNLFCVGFHGTTAPDYLLEWLREGRVGGIILFARNVVNRVQLLTLIHQLQTAATQPILISIDQEGGTVARLREGFREIPGAMAMSNTDNPDNAYMLYHLLGQDMRHVGINWNYAPVLDITYNRENATVGTRSFGTNPQRVAEYAREATRGLQSVGIAACAKHFPGLGNTAIDTHLALPVVDTPLEHLIANDLIPYREVVSAGIASIMTTHTIFSALDSQYPATLSPTLVKHLIRAELGFEGVVTTDCMEMKAIADNYGAGESAVLAILAGVDIVLFSHTRALQEQAFEAVIEAVESGRIPMERVEQANVRRSAMLYRMARPIKTPITGELVEPTIQNIARQSISLLRGHQPELEMNAQVAFIEFASLLESDVMESGGATGIKTILNEMQAKSHYIALNPSGDDGNFEQALALARNAKITVIATRNAHLIPEQAQRAQQLAQAGHRVVHLCLRNPYDAEILDAETVLCSFGDSRPSIRAILEGLVGDYEIKEGVAFNQ